MCVQIDCDGGEDEKQCAKSECADEYFACSNGNCIPMSFVCDGDQVFLLFFSFFFSMFELSV